MAEWFVAKSAEMADGDRRVVTAGSQEIGVFFKDGTFYAYSNYCLHSGGPACEGLLINRDLRPALPRGNGKTQHSRRQRGAPFRA